ncbi:MFS transporter [Rhodococcus rhodochrous]|uniref:MFS transporter n=1 Tax=Rhodococcus rhodochrous TaxID=1829 RepID=A0AAW4XNC3_RHORH|nr:MFS transporter [Rhodococcus rhodochrous]MCD2114568.1 MFS transporter [Rhodococcus rhodochrous]
MTETKTPTVLARQEKLPLGGLVVLAATGFLTVMLETVPSGILPAISDGLLIAESAAGQLVTIYAIGSIVGAIPIISATMGWPRRRLLVASLGGFAVTTAIVAVAPWFQLTLVARFLTGIFAGVTWGIIAGYASRITPARIRGRGMTIALAGAPTALAIGTPIGTLVAEMVGWRLTFLMLALFAVVILVWALIVLPSVPGQAAGQQTSVVDAVRRPGVVAVIVASVLFIMGHYVLYAYNSAFILPIEGVQVGAFLLVFGLASLVSLWSAGMLVDHHLRGFMLVSLVAFGVALVALGVISGSTIAVYVAAAVWGLGFGGASGPGPQKALVDAAGDAVDAAQAVLVTGWNIGIALGGIIGGVTLEAVDVGALPWAALVFILAAFIIVMTGRRNAFPARPMVIGSAPARRAEAPS